MPGISEKPTPKTPVAIIRDCHLWALNRLDQYLRSVRFWMVVAACVIVTAIAGPFHTLASLTVPLRFLYWTAVLTPAILLQFYLSMTVRELARRTGHAWGWAALFAGCVGGGVILLWVLGVNAALVENVHNFNDGQTAAAVFGLVVPITVLVNAFMPTLQPLWGFRRTSATKRPALTSLALSAGDASPFFDRLPPDLGRDVICVRAANHHIEVTTTRGHARVLMRLADAEADLATLPGMRVHRSWWVNLTMVSHTESRQGATDPILSTGARIPVSRGLRATVEEHLGTGRAR